MATKPSQVSRPADCVLEALATLAALLDRTIKEVKNLDEGFQSQLIEAVNDMEVSIRNQAAQHLEETVSEISARVRQEITDELTAKFEYELKSSMDSLRREFEAEQQSLNQQLNHAVETAAELEKERSRLAQQEAERDIIEEGKTLPEASAAAVGNAAPDANTASALIQEEIQRVEARVREISALIEDPDTELTSVIRKNGERSELEAYLRGIRLVIGR